MTRTRKFFAVGVVALLVLWPAAVLGYFVLHNHCTPSASLNVFAIPITCISSKDELHDLSYGFGGRIDYTIREGKLNLFTGYMDDINEKTEIMNIM